MAKKRKTLPKDFEELLDTGDIEEIKKVLSKCEIDAYGGYNKHTAIGFDNCPDEITRWHIEQGADVNALDSFKETALHHRAGSRLENVNIRILVELGADINHNLYRGGTPLHRACDRKCINNIKTLLELGADINIKNIRNKENALEYALGRCNNIDIIDILEVSNIMLGAGLEISDTMKESITKIGQNFEYFRPNFDKDSVDEYSQALVQLYRIYGVEPVEKRIMHDDISEIIVKSTRWQDQHQELWELLVPSNGHASTFQAEVIRISGKISRELLDNGGTNWDEEYKKMADAFLEYVQQGNALDEDTIIKLKSTVEDIKLTKGDLSYFTEMSVAWVLSNPSPIALCKTKYSR
ncbi:MAG: ankyrin repeat domain-containing protein [Marinifilaceae bacterium]|jgi:hypothetical protein|nr:ankyrin repeat domain-containing protein [Marinifilaceae bacterium]